MSTHPRLIAYADTPEHSHPLVLVVGREASKDSSLVDGIGKYDFDAVDSRFWTTAYSTLAAVGGTDLHSLRAACRQRRSSPIIFADALPVGIEHSNEDKIALRDRVTTDELDKHLSALLQMPILERLKIIVCAGHREGTRGSYIANAHFARAFDTFYSYAHDRDIQLLETPAMLRYNSVKIRDRLSNASTEAVLKIRDIFAVFD